MNRASCVWVVGHLEPWISELLLHADLDVRYASTWVDFVNAGAEPNALIVTPERQAERGFSLIIERYAQLPLVLLDDEDGPPTYDPADRSLVVNPNRTDAILEFLSAQLTLQGATEPLVRCRVPALLRVGDTCFVGRAVALSQRGLSVTLSGLRIGFDDVEVALITAGPCIRFEARVERHLRADGETHLGLVWVGLREEDVTRLLNAVRAEEAVDPEFDHSLSTLLDLASPEVSSDLPDWVERTLEGLSASGQWSERVLMGRVQSALQLMAPTPSMETTSITSDVF